MSDVQFSADLAINGAKQVHARPTSKAGRDHFTARFGPGVASVYLEKPEGLATAERLEAAGLTYEVDRPHSFEDNIPAMLRCQAD